MTLVSKEAVLAALHTVTEFVMDEQARADIRAAINLAVDRVPPWQPTDEQVERARVKLDKILRDLFGADEDDPCASSWPTTSRGLASAIISAATGAGEEKP